MRDLTGDQALRAVRRNSGAIGRCLRPCGLLDCDVKVSRPQHHYCVLGEDHLGEECAFVGPCGRNSEAGKVLRLLSLMQTEGVPL